MSRYITNPDGTSTRIVNCYTLNFVTPNGRPLGPVHDVAPGDVLPTAELMDRLQVPGLGEKLASAMSDAIERAREPDPFRPADVEAWGRLLFTKACEAADVRRTPAEADCIPGATTMERIGQGWSLLPLDEAADFLAYVWGLYAVLRPMVPESGDGLMSAAEYADAVLAVGRVVCALDPNDARAWNYRSAEMGMHGRTPPEVVAEMLRGLLARLCAVIDAAHPDSPDAPSDIRRLQRRAIEARTWVDAAREVGDRRLMQAAGRDKWEGKFTTGGVSAIREALAVRSARHRASEDCSEAFGNFDQPW